MLSLLESIGRLSDRKLRLFAVACSRRLFGKVSLPPYCWEQVHVAERYADGAAAADELACLHRYCNSTAEHACMNTTELSCGVQMADAAAGNAAWAASVGGNVMPDDGGQSKGRFATEAGMQCDLIRCIFGNPFQLVSVAPVWRTTTVVRLAQAIYEDRSFDHLPILADALEEAGCTDAAILGHLRGPGPHVRGCWVIDLLLGKS
jgi:hypothetical protein